jgi:hypothetical protein
MNLSRMVLQLMLAAILLLTQANAYQTNHATRKDRRLMQGESKCTGSCQALNYLVADMVPLQL